MSSTTTVSDNPYVLTGRELHILDFFLEKKVHDIELENKSLTS
jgi:hypothetical protein